jgi:hypothetical protein
MKGRDYLGDPGITVRIILKWVLKKQGVDQIHMTKRASGGLLLT